MFINQLLFIIEFNYYSKIVKSFDCTFYLKTIYQEDGDRHLFLPDLIKECILQIELTFTHIFDPHFYYLHL